MQLLGYFASGDGPFYFTETIRQLGWLPVIWRADEGFGTNHAFRLWYDYLLQLIVKLFSSVGFSWWWIDKFLWTGVIVVALYSSYVLGKIFLPKSYAFLTSLIYVTNTYFLMIFGGGQLGVTWGYALAPLVLASYIGDVGILKRGLLLAALTMVDLRMSYLVVASVVLWLILTRKKKFSWKSYILPTGAAIAINAFWILPFIAGGGKVDSTITGQGILKFFSVADFSHALTILHPNWPENLFGKVYFLQPEFIILSVIAFGALWFVKKKQELFYFAFLVLIGAFFAKGVNDPFGGVFYWMYAHIPGFVMFRDPTKFYLYIALGYSILIPFTISRMKYVRTAIILFVILWCFTIRQLFVGTLTGNFRLTQVPQDYVRLKNLLTIDTTPSRTLWIPHQEKFAYQSEVHPILNADELPQGATVSGQLLEVLRVSGIRYVIVPSDIEKHMFLSDYRFDSRKRQTLIAILNELPLQKVVGFTDIDVYKNDRFAMQTSVPSDVVQQQKLADIGLAVSALFICLFFIYYLFF